MSHAVNVAASLERMLRYHEAYARKLVEDLSPEQMTHCPGPGHENTPAFTLGHLITGADLIAQDLGLQSDMPAGYAELFLRRGPKDTRRPDAEAAYPPRDALLAELTRQHARIIAALRTKDPAWLAASCEKWQLVTYFPTNYDMLLFMAAGHMSMHLGQLAAWRRAQDLPAVLGTV
jgi:hypothetical protein